MINETHILEEDFSQQISQAYNDTIWTIKANPIYDAIKATKSYASILWKYGIQLFATETPEGYQRTARYLEESKLAFEQLSNMDAECFQCMILLGNTYLNL